MLFGGRATIFDDILKTTNAEATLGTGVWISFFGVIANGWIYVSGTRS